MPLISIIIRTKNEERWIGRCLRMVFQQKLNDFEVIVVDNNSSDKTLHIARKYPIKKVNIDDYLPGRAINVGVKASTGKFIVCLSAHCIPRDDEWLGNLYRNMEDNRIAGTYGRQLPFSYSSNLDKRDLLITFGLDHRIQIKDHFFHNANSIVRRDIWDKIPFDEEATNIEDRIWGKAVVDLGYRIAYDPEAAVYHYHGIHQDRDEERAKNVVRIMESLDQVHGEDSMPYGFQPEAMNVIAVLTVLGTPLVLANNNLLERCIKEVKSAKHINKIVVISENADALALATSGGVDIVKRPDFLKEPQVTVEQVLKYTLDQCEQDSAHYDAVLYANYLYPFRPKGFFDKLINEFAYSGVDSLVPTLKDYQPHWMQSEGRMVSYDAAFLPRDSKAPLQKGMVGLGSITCSEFIRSGRILGNNIALVPFEEQLYSMKANEPFAKTVLEMALTKGANIFGVKDDNE